MLGNYGPILNPLINTRTFNPLSQTSKIALGISTATLVIVLSMSIIRQQYFNQKSTLKVATAADFNGVTMDFKADGTYVLNSYSIGANYHYGSYTIRQNRIHLQPDKANKNPISDWLTIITEENGKKIVVEVDEMGIELERVTRFQVMEE